MKKLLALAAAGIAVNYFIKSEKGRKVQQQVKDWLKEAEEAINEKLYAATDKIESTARKIDSKLPGAHQI